MGMFDGGGIFGSLNGGGDLYGDMLTPQQKQALAWRGMMAAAGALGQAAMPSRMPVPLGAALGAGAAAMGTAQDEGLKSALQAMLHGAQAEEAKRKTAVLKSYNPNDIFTDTPTAAPATGAPVLAPVAGGVSSGSMSQRSGGWGPHANTAIETLTGLGHTPAATQGILANGLGEGGFKEPWTQSWVSDNGQRENSFGHWQFNKNGELPGYLAFAQGRGNPQDTALQAQYVAQRMEELHPGFSKITDPKLATDLVATKFERYKGAAPGQRYGLLADAQRYMSGGAGAVEAREPIPEVPNALEAFNGEVRSRFGGAAPVRASAADAGSPPPFTPPPGEISVPGKPGVVIDGKWYPSVRDWNLASDARGVAASKAALSGRSSAPPDASIPVPNGAPSAPQIRPPMTPQQAAQVPSAPFSLAGPPIQQPAGPMIGGRQIDPGKLALQGMRGMLGGLPDIMKPVETFYYQSPSHQGQVESFKKWAGVAPDLYTKWNDPQNSPEQRAKIEAAIFAARQPVEQQNERFKTELGIGAANNAPQSLRPNERIDINPNRVPLPAPAGMAFGGAAGVPRAATGQMAQAQPGGVTLEGANSADITRLETRGKNEEEARKEILAKAGLSAETRAGLMNMYTAAGNFTQGPFAQHAQAAKEYLRLISPSFDKPVANYEDFTKNAETLVRQAVRATDSNPAAVQFPMIRNSLPSARTSPQGLRIVTNELIGLHDYNIGSAHAVKLYEDQNNGSSAGFQTWWQKQASPYAFMVSRMHPEDLKEVATKLGSSEQGRRELIRLQEQVAFLKRAGLVD